MPRVVQVPSSDSNEDLEGSGIPRYQYRSDSSDSDTDRNRNYNQRMPSGGTDTLSSYLNYVVNYSLYNVTYHETDDPYCLTCVIDGKEERFKKDARVWLHKSSERKRKFDKEDSNSDATTNKSSKMANQELELLREQIRKLDSDKFINIYKDAMESDLKSELSSLADSEAELVYSEESSSGTEQNAAYTNSTHADVTKYTPGSKTVRFDQTIDISNDYRVTTVSSSSDEDCVHTVGSRSTVSYRSVLSEDDSLQSNRFGGNVDYYNESKNNFRSGILASDMTRIAPAISIETESLNESLLDYAVNLHNKPNDINSSGGSHLKSALRKDVGYRILQASHTVMMKMKNKTKRGRVEKKVPARCYNLRSMKKTSGREANKRKRKARGTGSTLTEQKMAPEVEDSEGAKEFVKSITNDSKFNWSSNSVETDQNHNCIRSVPTLFVLASIRWYKMLKCNFALFK